MNYTFPVLKPKYKIGVISDTHGLLRPEAIKILHGSDLILHAGDIGDPALIKRLEEISPVIAVRGNIDVSPELFRFPAKAEIVIGGKKILLLHNINDFIISPEENNIDVLISGHSHKSMLEKKGDVFYFNPGSAGKRRFHFPLSVGEIKIYNQEIILRIIEILKE